jgi:mitochondrial fission protein ELM1
LRGPTLRFLKGTEPMSGPKSILILSDGIRGHVNQSRGVALWLGRLSGAAACELEVPRLSGLGRFTALKVRARSLAKGDKEAARSWLENSGGSGLLGKVFQILEESKVAGRDVLCLSTGSSAAPYGLALARVIGARSATVMTPSVLGTEPFDFAIVPVHDAPVRAENIYPTLGAPNAIDGEKLSGESEALFTSYPPRSSQRWGVLVGGDDANYRISPGWVKDTIGQLADLAVEAKADLYVTTSRRTSSGAEQALVDLADRFPVFRMLFLASKDPANPVPGILGGCQAIFCTEDSVSMVSEAATAGFAVRILRVGKKAGLRRVLQVATSWLVGKRALPYRFLWGAPRFDAMLESFKAKGLATEAFGKEVNAGKTESPGNDAFNEARDTAAWIVRKWDRKEHGAR